MAPPPLLLVVPEQANTPPPTAAINPSNQMVFVIGPLLQSVLRQPPPESSLLSSPRMIPRLRWTSTLAMALACAGAGACGGGQARVAVPNGGHDTSSLARCSVAADRRDPLVTEWPASSKARLEALMRDPGGIAVAYTGCELRIVDGCRVTGTYEWRRTTLSTDTTDVRDEDELYAKLPLGAASLGGELRAGGALKVVTEVSGQMALTGFLDDQAPEGAACESATHVVRGMSVGAFRLLAVGTASASGGVALGNVSGGAGSSETSSLLREAGDPAKCDQATAEAPDPSCRSPIQIFLDPMPRAPQVDLSQPIVYAPAPGFGSQAPHEVRTRPRGSSGPSWVPWVLEGVGLGAAGTGAFFLVQAQSGKNAIQAGGFSTGGDIQSKASSAAVDTNLGFILVSVGVTLALTAIPFFFTPSGPTTVATGRP